MEVFFQTRVLKIKLWAHNVVGRKVGSWYECRLYIYIYICINEEENVQRHKMFLDHRGLTTRKASSLGGKLLHCSRRVKTQQLRNHWQSWGGHKKVSREKGEEMAKVQWSQKLLNLPSAKGSSRSGEMIICLRRALYSSSRSAIFAGRCSANGSYCKTKMGSKCMCIPKSKMARSKNSWKRCF